MLWGDGYIHILASARKVVYKVFSASSSKEVFENFFNFFRHQYLAWQIFLLLSIMILQISRIEKLYLKVVCSSFWHLKKKEWIGEKELVSTLFLQFWEISKTLHTSNRQGYEVSNTQTIFLSIFLGTRPVFSSVV